MYAAVLCASLVKVHSAHPTFVNNSKKKVINKFKDTERKLQAHME